MVPLLTILKLLTVGGLELQLRLGLMLLVTLLMGVEIKVPFKAVNALLTLTVAVAVVGTGVVLLEVIQNQIPWVVVVVAQVLFGLGLLRQQI
jgi:hypothetical protein